MADQDEAAAVVVLAQVLLPGLEDVGIGQAERLGLGARGSAWSPMIVTWRYIGAKTRQRFEKRAAWYWAIAVWAASTSCPHSAVGCWETVG